MVGIRAGVRPDLSIQSTRYRDVLQRREASGSSHRRVRCGELRLHFQREGFGGPSQYRHSGRAVHSAVLAPGTSSGQFLLPGQASNSTPHTPTESDLRLFDILALQAADFIERKEAENVRGRLAALVESSDDAIVSKDLNGIIRSWNAGAERLFGYTAQEAIGRPILMLIPSDHADEERSILERIRRGERIEHYETIRRRKDGTLVDISLTVSPIVDEHGRIVGASKIARDITDRKRHEVERREMEEKERALAVATALRETEAELARDQFDLVEVESLIDGHHQAEVLEGERNDVRGGHL